LRDFSYLITEAKGIDNAHSLRPTRHDDLWWNIALIFFHNLLSHQFSKAIWITPYLRLSSSMSRSSLKKHRFYIRCNSNTCRVPEILEVFFLIIRTHLVPWYILVLNAVWKMLRICHDIWLSGVFCAVGHTKIQKKKWGKCRLCTMLQNLLYNTHLDLLAASIGQIPRGTGSMVTFHKDDILLSFLLMILYLRGHGTFERIQNLTLWLQIRPEMWIQTFSTLCSLASDRDEVFLL
jgi:hypothetical protein